MHRNLLILPILAALLALNGCDAGKAAAPQTAVTAERPAAWQGNLLENAEALQAAETALKNLPQFRGKNLSFFENIDFFGGVRPRIEIDIHNPNRPGQIDHYRYEPDGWHYTDTLRTEPDTDIPAKLTPLSTVRFADAAAIAARWRQKAQSAGAVVTEPYYVSFVLLEKEPKRFWHTAAIEAVGRQYYLSFHADGTLWEFKPI